MRSMTALPNRVLWGAMALAIGCTSPGAASAAPRFVRVFIARKPARAALIDFALQTNLSLGGDLESCRGESPALSGRTTVTEGLRRLLAGTGCSFTQADAHTIVIQRAPLAPVRPRPTPTPPASPTAPAAVGLPELVVTAPRAPDLQGRTPYAISALSGLALERTAATSLADLTGEMAGVVLTNLGPGRDKILLRGVSDGPFTGGSQSTVALYLDDVPITYNAPDPDLRLADLERVEVLRGPQGTLYGGGSIGGVVRLATRKPDLDAFGGGLIVGASTMAGGGVGTEAEGVLNLPLSRGRAALRLVAYRERADGYIDNSALHLDGVNVSARDGARLALRVEIAPNWTGDVGIVHQSINTADTQYGLRRLGPLSRDSLVQEPHDNDFDQTNVSLAGTGAWGRLTLSAASLRHHLDSRYDATAAAPLFGLPAGPAAFDEENRIELEVAELAYASPAGPRLHGVAGAFLSSGDILRKTMLAATPARGTAGYQETRSDKVTEVAVYGEVTYDLSDQLAVTSGLRAFRFNFRTASDVAQPTGTRAFDGNGEASGFSPKLLVRYAPQQNLVIYAQAAEGYRPSGFNTAGRIGETFDGAAGHPHRRYVADELLNYEIGAKVVGPEGVWRARVAAFYATWEAIQSDQYLADGLAHTATVGDGDNRGVEVEASWRLNARLDLRAATLLDDPQIVRLAPDFAGRTDAGLPAAPTWSGNLSLDYHRPVLGDLTLRLQGQAAFTGRSHLKFDADPAHVMGDYVSLRLSARLEALDWSLMAYVDNPFDSTANTFAFGNPFNVGGEPQATALRPRTLAVRLQRSF